jgi:hypothetical protein
MENNEPPNSEEKLEVIDTVAKNKLRSDGPDWPYMKRCLDIIASGFEKKLKETANEVCSKAQHLV